MRRIIISIPLLLLAGSVGADFGDNCYVNSNESYINTTSAYVNTTTTYISQGCAPASPGAGGDGKANTGATMRGVEM